MSGISGAPKKLSIFFDNNFFIGIVDEKESRTSSPTVFREERHMGFQNLQGAHVLDYVSSQDFLPLALQALSVLADDEERHANTLGETLLAEFCDAFLSADDMQRHGMIDALIKRGASKNDIIHSIVPSAARKIGEMWVRDEVSFAEVTISSARLQDLVRKFSEHSPLPPPGVTIPLGSNVLVVVPKEENHTMGAFVAADQLRRSGLWVHMALGQTANEIARSISSNNFAMVGISSASRRMVGPVSEIVSAIRLVSPKAQIALGGNIVNLVDGLKDLTGADIVTTNTREAVSACGLPIPGNMLRPPTTDA